MLSSDSVFHDSQTLLDSWQHFDRMKADMGSAFYQLFLGNYPQYIPYFGRADMDTLSAHLFEALGILAASFSKFEAALPILHNLGEHFKYHFA